MADTDLNVQMRVGELIEAASAINKIKVRHSRLLFGCAFLHVISFDHSSLSNMIQDIDLKSWVAR